MALNKGVNHFLEMHCPWRGMWRPSENLSLIKSTGREGTVTGFWTTLHVNHFPAE